MWSYHHPWLLLGFHLIWSLLAFSVLMGKELMGLPWYPGSAVSSMLGMPPALTHMPCPTQLLQPKRLEEWPTKQSCEVCTPGPQPSIHTHNHWDIRRFWVRHFKLSLAIALNRHSESAMPTLTCFKGYQLHSNEEMRLLLWVLWASIYYSLVEHF